MAVPGDWRSHVRAQRQRGNALLARGAADLDRHKFKIGDVVEAAASLFKATPPGPYDVVRLLPPVGMSKQYRLKSRLNGHERVVREEDIFRNDN
jgi:hypothetical protein